MQSTRRLAFRSLLASSPISDDTAGGIRLFDTRALATVTASSLNAVTSLSRQRVRARNSIESDIFQAEWERDPSYNGRDFLTSHANIIIANAHY